MTTTLRTLTIAGLLAGATCVAYAAMPRTRAFDPPTAAELGLDGATATEWNTLRDQTIDLRDSSRAEVQQQMTTLRALLATDSPDLDAFEKNAEREVDSRLAAARALRQRKLAFYDGLAPAQQANVRAVMRERLDRLARLRAAMQDLATAP